MSKNDSAILLRENDDQDTKRPFKKRSRVQSPTVSISPSTLRLMEENERIIETYGKKRSKFIRPKEDADQ
ncbi:type II toxin-antitoxin system SpoIISB family antitoxin [Pullulanibacillus sp. KACC 23026]|uniref:type II toxin-antitoxin system SpoIISB family antitoxin n=1 Tax=Pullulanibacillus sp. KACC 23026 TaxID=3028315 RepID=UPI0023AF4096|nr:type II toxin-antitoxin system SpoIISB family antitoxin [Pullulanibacillus sp. KACC 23026]WEG11040.1 type II toxin-antitoxin system SpoIISB family antitoxin [Pullulanibacillus sp. KACC 23026]